MKTYISALFVLCIFTTFFCNINIFASEVASDSSTQSVEAEEVPFDYDKVYKVGYFTDFTDFAYDLNTLNYKGYGVEIFEKIQEISDLKFEYVEVEGALSVALESGEIDILAFLSKTETRANEFLFADMPFGKTYLALLSKDMDIGYADFDKIDGKTVATFNDNIANERLDFLAENLGFSVEYIYEDNHNYMDIDADFYLGFSEARGISIYNNVLDVGVYSLFPVTTYENQQLMDKLNAIFYDIAITEGNFFLELEEKYLASNTEMTHRGLMPSELSTLKQRPLEVGYISHFDPLSFTNEDGQPDGAMVEILNIYADEYGFEINYHPYNLTDPPESYENYDILVTLYGEAEREREHYVTTEPYYLIPLYAQINKEQINTVNLDEALSTSPKIGILPYQTVDFSLFLGAYPDTELIFYNDWYDLLDNFEVGNVDMLMCTASATAFAELYLDNENIQTIHTDTNIPMQFFINKDIEEEYLPIFNVMIDRMSESEYDAIIESHSNAFLPEQNITITEFLLDYWYYVVIVLFIFIACFIAIHLNGQIKKREALLTSYNTDSLTGLMTINKFASTVESSLKNARPNEYEIVSFDIDMFKTINTHFSSDKGTNVIIAVGDALKRALGDTSAAICRNVADQFLLFRKVGEGGTLRQIYTTDILPNIRNNITNKYNVSLSFGNYIIENTKESFSSIVGQADTARKQGKNTHKTTFFTFDKKMRKKYEDKINITFRMEQALKDKEFVVEYQPKIDFNTLTIGGAEALVRWHPKFGEKIYPDEFIPVFEANGFISYLDLYVLDQVCIFIKEKPSKMELPRISVNLSAHTILSDNIVNRISDVLSLHKISPSLIELELTESAVESDTETFLAVVKRLKKLGYSISIDDFGAGVSSLNRLSAVEADVLKLDKAFFDLKEQGGKSTVVVTNIINMAKHLNMKVVAEGVETAAQAMWLKGINCDYAQGYYFAKPMPVDAFKELLISKKQYKIELF